MSYVPNPDLPTEVYYSRGSLYDSARSLKAYMTEQLNRYVASRNRNSNRKRLDPEGVDFTDFNPTRIYQLVHMDGKSIAQWDDITNKIMEDRISNMRSKV